MKNNLKKIILFITVIIQFITAITVNAYGSLKDASLEKYGKEFKVKLDSVELTNGTIRVYCYTFYFALSGPEIDYGRYTVFTSDENGFAVLTCSPEKPQDGCFMEIPYDFYKNDIIVRFSKYSKSDLKEIEAQLDFPAYLYERENEKDNCLKGYCTGELTDAYVTVIVYNNRLKVENVTINGMNIDDYLDSCVAGKIDLSRYEYNLYGHDMDSVLEWEEDYAEEMNESVTDEYGEDVTTPQTVQ